MVWGVLEGWKWSFFLKVFEERKKSLARSVRACSSTLSLSTPRLFSLSFSELISSFSCSFWPLALPSPPERKKKQK